MRFESLQIEKYGHLDGLSLDLSDREVALHVIHGPNEAGKSTVLSAIGDLLFGIDERSRYNFRFEYGRLRIGATLSNAAGQTLSVKRRKGRSNSLLKPDESAPLPENCLAPYLGGVTESFFKRMFGLNHERLRSGGKELLDSRGDLASNLFEAGSGVVGLSALAKALGDDAGAIGSPALKSSSKPYWRAHQRYDEANARMRAEALKPDAWNAANRRVEEAIVALKDIGDRLETHRRERSSLERVRRVTPLLRRIDDLAAIIAELGEVPRLPDTFEETWRQAVETDKAARARLERLSEECRRREGDLDQLGDPGPWAALRDRIEKAAHGLDGYRTRRDDLPRRIRDLEIGGKRMADLVRQLGAAVSADEIVRHRPSAPILARIRALIAAWNRLEAERDGAEAELAKAEQRHGAAAAASEQAGAAQDPAIAQSAWDAATAMGDTAGRRTRARRELEIALHSLAQAVSALGRWSLGADELARVALPDAGVIVSFEQRSDRLAKDQLDAAARRQALEADQRRIEAELHLLQVAGEVPTAAALDLARSRRDQGWRLIRRKYLDKTVVPEAEFAAFDPSGDGAAPFEAALAGADRLADRRELEAARVERFASLSGQGLEVAADILAASERIATLQHSAAAMAAEWAALWAGSGISPGSPGEMRRWLIEKDKILALHQAATKSRHGLDGAEDEEALLRGHLLRAAATLGLDPALERDTAALRDEVRVAVARLVERWAAKSRLERDAADTMAECEQRRRDIDRVEQLLAGWRQKWGAEMPSLGLEPGALPVEAEAALLVWQNIGELEAELAQTRKRRDQLQDAVEIYQAEIRTLVADLGDAAADLPAETDVADIVPILQQRLGLALAKAATIEEARRNLGLGQQELQAAEALAGEAARELQRLRDRHGLGGDADVLALARRSRGLIDAEAASAEARAALIAQGDGYDEEALRRSVAAVDADRAAAEVARLETEISRLQQAAQQAAQEVTTTEDELKRLRDGAGIGQAAQEANEAAAEMAAHVERWLRFRAAAMILNRAVERYRAQHENPLVRRASEIFERVAGTGANPIIRLSVDYTEEERPVLVGFRRDGTLCPVAGMSDGTVDQLHLALRIAAVERYAEGGEPMPFIADDLFITSDEQRTLPGIKALAELGKRTQVLLFTHHHYVVDAARAALEPRRLKVHHLRNMAEMIPAAAPAL